jgi:transposase-like protein
MKIVLQLPETKRINSARPRKCKHCQGETFQRWGRVVRKVKDPRMRSVVVHRYRCTSCTRTFRHYPQGVTAAQQTERMKKLAVICWSLGLSYRGLELILSAFGVVLSRMSGWRDVQAEGQALRRNLRWKPARLVGVDGAWLNGQGVMVAVDLGDGKLLDIAHIDEKDKAAVTKWLRTLKQQHDIGAIVTDDLSVYPGIAEQLEVGHQVCQFHVRRWVGRTCWELKNSLPEDWLWAVDEIKALMADMPPTAPQRLHALWKQVPGNKRRKGKDTPLEQLRRLLARLMTSWERYTTFFHDPEIPWTNNLTEQAIGRFKSRARRTRGYKTEQGRLNGILVSSQSWI